MSRVLLLDTSFAAKPIHDWLLSEAFEVWTVSNRPDDVLARRNPERYLQDNYANTSVVQAHVDRLAIDYVVPGCTDVSIETALRLTGLKSRFDSVDTYRQIADKGAFRALCDRLELPAPKRVFEDRLPYPGKLIAKPVDSFSGRGISVFDGEDLKAGQRALADARSESPTGEAIIETFIHGQLFSYSCFLKNQQVVGYTLVHEVGSVTPYAVDTSYVVDDFPERGVTDLKAVTERIAIELELVDGLLHIQFIWDGYRPSLIELSRRCPGDLYPRLVELSTGKPHAAMYASYFVDRQAPEFTAVQPRPIIRHTITAGHCNYEAVWFDQPEPVLEFHSIVQIGRAAPSSAKTDRVALLFLEYPTSAALVEDCELLLQRSHYKTVQTIK